PGEPAGRPPTAVERRGVAHDRAGDPPDPERVEPRGERGEPRGGEPGITGADQPEVAPESAAADACVRGGHGREPVTRSEHVERRHRGEDLLVRRQDAGSSSTMEVDDPSTDPDRHGDVPPRHDAIDRAGPRRIREQDPRSWRRRARGSRGRGGRRSEGGSGGRDEGRMPGRRRVRHGRAGNEHQGGAAPPRRDTTHSGSRGYASLMIAAEWFFIVFRILHIGAGTVWVGSVFFLVVFVQPSAAAIAPAGAPFMSELLVARRLVARILIIAG